MIKDYSFFQQIEDDAYDRALLKPILKEAREDRNRIARLEAALRVARDELALEHKLRLLEMSFEPDREEEEELEKVFAAIDAVLAGKTGEGHE